MKSSDMHADPQVKAIAILFTLLVVGAVVGIAISKLTMDYVKEKIKERFNKQIRRSLEEVYTLRTVVVCMNIFLLLGLLWVYISSFRKTYSSFLLGLSIFICVLLFQSFLSLPPLHLVFGGIYQQGIFSTLSSLFETVALVILFYLSME